MGDHDQRVGPAENTRERAFEGFGIEGGEALVEDAGVEGLKQRAGDEEAALLAVRELPAALADELFEAGGHSREQWAEVELVQDRFGLGDVFAARGPSATEQEVERQAGGEHVVLVELGRGADPRAPVREAESALLDAREAEHASLGDTQTGQQRAQR